MTPARDAVASRTPRVWPEDGTRPPLVGTEEPVFLHALHGDYRGALPAYYDAADCAEAAVLERHFDDIRDEVCDLLARRPEVFTENFVPNGYQLPRFRSLNLFTDGRRYHANRALLPATTAICDGLEGVSSALIGVLDGGGAIPEHVGDTNVMLRLHLPLVVPHGLPEIGIRVAGHDAPWVEGRVLAFEDAHRHQVWNHSDESRVILLVDVVKPELRRRARWIRATAGSGIVVQILAARVPRFDRLPATAVRAIHAAGSVAALCVEPLQHRLPAARRGGR